MYTDDFVINKFTKVPAVNKVHEFCLQASRRHETFMNIHEPLKCLADQKKIAKASRKAKKVSHGIEREDGERPTKKSRHNGA